MLIESEINRSVSFFCSHLPSIKLVEDPGRSLYDMLNSLYLFHLVILKVVILQIKAPVIKMSFILIAHFKSKKPVGNHGRYNTIDEEQNTVDSFGKE